MGGLHIIIQILCHIQDTLKVIKISFHAFGLGNKK